MRPKQHNLLRMIGITTILWASGCTGRVVENTEGHFVVLDEEAHQAFTCGDNLIKGRVDYVPYEQPRIKFEHRDGAEEIITPEINGKVIRYQFPDGRTLIARAAQDEGLFNPIEVDISSENSDKSTIPCGPERR